MPEPVVVRSEGPFLIVTLNDPERANPLSSKMVTALAGVLEKAALDQAVRAVIIAGAGRHFSAGADLEALERIASEGSKAENHQDVEQLRRLFEVLLGCPKLTVAAVQGAAVAGGCGLATGCDFVVAEPGARFAYTEVKIGFLAAIVLTFLPRRVPGHIVRRMLLDPEMVDGPSALQIGLADELAPEGEALTAAIALAQSICAKASPSALAATKHLLNETVGLNWREALKTAASANVDQRVHPECARGVRAFLESKRTPNWLDEDEDSE